MSSQHLTIASRKSPLAMYQSEYVRDQLLKANATLKIVIESMMTQGDQLQATPLNKIGGKGLFVKELEKAILEQRADMAVHSMKDMPMTLPPGLTLAAILERENPLDAMVSNHFTSIHELPRGATVGTSSLRRQCQLLATRPDLHVIPIRGNVGTRLRKLDEGQYDALIMAAAGLQRLGLADRIAEEIAAEVMLPAAGQGAIGVECPIDNQLLLATLSQINHVATAQCLTAERAITERLGGSCQIPIGAFARIINDELVVEAIVGWPDGHAILRASGTGTVEDGAAVGTAIADALISQGANEIIGSLV